MNEALVVFVRGMISFFTLLIFTRALGKQQIAQITFFDYIVGITIGSIAASLTVDLSSAIWPHWAGLFVWAGFATILQLISLKSKKLSKYINDKSIIAIHDGIIIGDNLKKINFTLTELLGLLRLKDIFDLNEVKFGMIETNGQLSVLTKTNFENMVYSMNIKLKNDEVNNELIFNGIIIEDNLSKYKIDKEWLIGELNKQGFESPIEVFYAYLDSSRKLKVDTYRNKIITTKDIFK
ncbi:MAG: DUF421 domain-containing protein [Clostridiaceae bacterium]|nr:DUF421 domain-containing protein [Clostridiaceae bacterium]